jgi:hypothetical protein
MVVTLMDVLKDLNMTPSRARTGKGPRDEREFLRYKAHIGEITAPPGGKWQWDDDDEELEEIKLAMKSFKEEGSRAPSGWKKLPKKEKGAAEDANDGESKKKAAAGKAEKKRSRSSSDDDNKTDKKPRKVKAENGSAKKETDEHQTKAKGAVKKEEEK